MRKIMWNLSQGPYIRFITIRIWTIETFRSVIVIDYLNHLAAYAIVYYSNLIVNLFSFSIVFVKKNKSIFNFEWSLSVSDVYIEFVYFSFFQQMLAGLIAGTVVFFVDLYFLVKYSPIWWIESAVFVHDTILQFIPSCHKRIELVNKIVLQWIL